MGHDELPDNGEYEESEFQHEKREGHRHHRTVTKRRWVLSPLWIAIFLEAALIAGLIIWGTLLEQDYLAVSERERSLGLKLRENQSELEGLKYDLNEKLAANQETCLPRIVTLKTDEFLDINKDYVKRAFFVLAGKKDKKVLEYKIVLKNDTKINLTPKFTIVFYNTAGNEVGTSQFGSHADGSASEKVLERGEVRSVDGVFEMGNLAQPDSFMIKIVND